MVCVKDSAQLGGGSLEDPQTESTNGGPHITHHEDPVLLLRHLLGPHVKHTLDFDVQYQEHTGKG